MRIRENLSYSSNLERSSGVARPSGVTPLRCSNHLGSQCCSLGIATSGCASTIRRSNVVPAFGHPTMNRNGFTTTSPPVGAFPACEDLGRTKYGSSTRVLAPPRMGVGRSGGSRVRREDHRPLLQSARHLR